MEIYPPSSFVLVFLELKKSLNWKKNSEYFLLQSFSLKKDIPLQGGITIEKPELPENLLKRFIPVPIEESVKRSLSGLLSYVLETQLMEPNTSFDYSFIHREDHMKLDSTVLAHLELFETLISKERRGSLLGLLDQAVTPMGSRLHREWIARPLQSVEAIRLRQDLISYFYDDPLLLTRLRSHLEKVHDLERLLSKLVFSHIMPKDLRKITASLEGLPEILAELEEMKDHDLLSGLRAFPKLYQRLDETLLDDPAATIADGGVISPVPL